ncbi:MAG: hypothetical protein J3Q66DRAFT_259894, partial [Benniella sp.]
KARAIGASVALKRGIPVEEIVVQGNWSSSSIVNDLYRLFRATAQNLADVVLD